ncbi:Heterokaryon incompatibility protein 6, OR allele [Fusarium oxysporum f. sp. raphani]|nr:Heterokaryon incompatibility protein 6, OR allele [Fusarium oxysporum f. sp. raphani]
MLGLAYFSRVWIIQEIAVAKSYRILWGEITIPGHILYRSTPGWLLAHSALKLPDAILAFKNAAMLLFGNHVVKDWYHLVVRFMDYEATDPPDKIYALIGLADQTGYDIVADYSMPVLEVYRDFAVKMISVTKKLDILQYSTVQDLDAEKVPLWVPDFQKVAKEPIYFSRTQNASKDTKAIVATSYGHDTLSLRGVSVDNVAVIVMPETPSQELWESAKQRFRQVDPSLPDRMLLDLQGWGPTTWILNVFKMVDEHKPVISRQNDGDLITWLLNSVTACSVPTSMLTDFWEYLALAIARFMLMPNKNNEIKLLIKLLRLLAQASPPPLEWESILEEQHRQALRAVLVEIYDNEDEIDSALELIKLLRIRPHRNDNSFNNSVKEDRMFFITEDGYLGIGPKSMRPGDHVCVLYGGHTPFVLRPVRGAGDEEYLFLGESLVNGLMNGEASEDEGAVDKWFHLR